MCGIAGIVDSHGRASHGLVRQALVALDRMRHRGAQGSDEATGDGAGVLTQLPHDLLAATCGFALPPRGAYALGVLFLPRDPAQAAAEKARFEKLVIGEGLAFLGWRDVPVDSTALGDEARRTEPLVAHAIIEAGSPEQLYRCRSRCAAVMSLSTRTLVYKGLMLPSQLDAYYRDLDDPRFLSALALVHSRFSTNTFPSWQLAHPFNYLCHNGEINALSGNLNWLAAREEQLARKLFGRGARDVRPFGRAGRSDSAHLDEMLSLLLLSGHDLAEAMMLLMPEPWQSDDDKSSRRAFFRYHAPSLEPWDGPAAVCFSDGRFVGAALDRNGLRPCRYAVTRDGRVMIASEVGAFPFDAQETVELGRLAPGGLLLVDTETGRIARDAVIKEEVSLRHPYAAWLATSRLRLEQLPLRVPPPPPSVPLARRQRAFGYTAEDLQVVLAPMATSGEEPVSSMGVDTPLAALSDRARPLFDYFVQSFAQVTNPPIDPLREQRVMSASSFLGARPALGPAEPPAGVILELAHPVLDELTAAKLRRAGVPSLVAIELALTFPARGGPHALRDRLAALQAEAVSAARAGATVVILSDRGVNPFMAAVPSLLGVAAVQQALVRAGCRMQADIVVEAGDARGVHDLACLVGYGATAVHPYLALESLAAAGFDAAGRERYVKALVKGLLKVLSKMGISVLQAYCGAGLFEALGLDDELVQSYFTGTTSRIQGINLQTLQEEVLRRHVDAFQGGAGDALEHAGIVHFRSQGERHRWHPAAIHRLQEAARRNDFASYRAFAEVADGDPRRPNALRDLLAFKEASEPLPLSEVEPAASIVRRFTSGAMSLGAISSEAHESLAIALNGIGGRSNSGEGGEDARRFATPRNSTIKQVASGRFGVTAHYLMSATELQIKMAQGAKPGEGGQLPGEKVDELIARLRHSMPGVSLISPPPHHDIYSIEDLAQLIFDLRQVNPSARISVKLVARAGVGTVAAGVAKARADKIVISGDAGGTGAAALSSIRHAGVPWELGLAETHQTLVRNGLRGRVVLETDGQLRTGRDVVLAALLGADEFGFATAPLIALGCVMMRKCHLNICPVGIATQDPELRRKFTGQPEHVVNYLFQVAEDVRHHMARLGFRTVAEMVGRSDRLERVAKTGHWKADGVSVDAMLRTEPRPTPVATEAVGEAGSRVDRAILSQHAPAGAFPLRFGFQVDNSDRAIGARLSGHVAARHGVRGLPRDSLHLDLAGIAGQSLGAFLAPGITLVLRGQANDYVGKGMCGGVIAIRSPLAGGPHLLIGNTALYGATSGELYVAGMAGERFAVRNSGATAVVEGVGDHGCEYMTGGVVVVLGDTGWNFGAGMSGGRAYVLDERGDFRERCNHALVSVAPIDPSGPDGDDLALLWQLLRAHLAMTGSLVAQRLLRGGREALAAFVRVLPREYERALERRRAPIDSVLQHETRP
jgi:glutamate synthase domain-containing protein 2/glutamate synthase domain-containing protein 1/glutamate synthase domain-containing protein 3